MNPTNLATGDKFIDARGVTWEVIDVIDASMGQYALKEWKAARLLVVSNKAALANLTEVSDGDEIRILGYYTPGDGGYRITWYDFDAVDTVDDVSVFAGPVTSAAPTGQGRFKGMDLAYQVTFRQGGCKCDGTNDWARAVAVLALGKRTVVDPQSTISISGTLTVATAYQEVVGCRSGKFKQLTPDQILFNVTANYVVIDGVNADGQPTGSSIVSDQGRFISAVDRIGLRIRNCHAHEFTFCAVRVQNCKAASICDNYVTGIIGTNQQESSSGIQAWGNCDGLIISRNFILDDSDVGIMVGSLSGDNLITISNNLVCTMNAAGVIVNPTNRRRGIAAGYQIDGDANTDVIVSDNLVWGSINAGIYFIGWGGAITITGNRVGNTSLDTDPIEESLSGGISVLGSAKHIIIDNNDVSNQSSTATGCINVYRQSGATANMGSAIITGNQIHDTTSPGVTILGITDRVSILGNMIWNTGKTAIHIASDSGMDTKGLRIAHNIIVMNVNNAHGIYYDTQGETNQVVIESNYIESTHASPGGFLANSSTHAGVYSRYPNITLVDNEIRKFGCAWYVENYQTGRITKQHVSRNRFINNAVACVVRGTTGHTVAFIENDNVFIGNTAISGDGFGYDAIRIGSYDRDADQFTMKGTGAPALFTAALGDRIKRTAPTAGGYAELVATGAGTPGTWKDCCPIAT